MSENVVSIIRSGIKDQAIGDSISSIMLSIVKQQQEINCLEDKLETSNHDMSNVERDFWNMHSDATPKRRRKGLRQSFQGLVDFRGDAMWVLTFAVINLISGLAPVILRLMQPFLGSCAGMIRPPERVKKRVSRQSVAFMTFLLLAGQLPGAVAIGASDETTWTGEVGRPLNMTTSQDITGNCQLEVHFTPFLDKSKFDKLCSYNTTSMTSNSHSSQYPEASCLRNGISILNVKRSHAGNYNLLSYCGDTDNTVECNFNLTVNGDSSLWTVEIPEPSIGHDSNETDSPWVSNTSTIVCIVITVAAAIVVIAIVILYMRRRRACLQRWPVQKTGQTGESDAMRTDNPDNAELDEADERNVSSSPV